MGSVREYFSSLGTGIASLLKGMKVTGKEFITPKITECYPENRDTHHRPKGSARNFILFMMPKATTSA